MLTCRKPTENFTIYFNPQRPECQLRLHAPSGGHPLLLVLDDDVQGQDPVVHVLDGPESEQSFPLLAAISRDCTEDPSHWPPLVDHLTELAEDGRHPKSKEILSVFATLLSPQESPK